MQRALLTAPSWVLPGASADLDFTHGRYWAGGSTSLSSLLSCSRASSGLAQFANGGWQSLPANTPRITDQGLLIEQAATNLFLNSSAPATQTIALSATGSYTLTCWGASGSATVAAGTAAGSGFGAANASTRGGQITFAITDAGTVTVTISGSLLYVQVEAGAFGTSPVITGGSSATRAADTITLIGGALTAAVNAKAARFVTNLVGGFKSNNVLLLYSGVGQAIGFGSATIVETYNGSTAALAIIGGSGTITGLVKSACGFDGTSITAIANGGTKATSTSAFGAVVSPVYLGSQNASASQLNGYMIRATLSSIKGTFDNLTTGSAPQ